MTRHLLCLSGTFLLILRWVGELLSNDVFRKDMSIVITLHIPLPPFLSFPTLSPFSYLHICTHSHAHTHSLSPTQKHSQVEELVTLIRKHTGCTYLESKDVTMPTPKIKSGSTAADVGTYVRALIQLFILRLCATLN